MKASICRLCGSAHWSTEPHRFPNERPTKRKLVEDFEPQPIDADEEEGEPPLDENEEDDPTFDRKKYQREYMRKWREGQHFTVYIMIDPRYGTPFYVGISFSPETRFAQHKFDPASAAYNRIQELLSVGQKPTVRVIARLKSNEDARRLESALIDGIDRAIGTLVNRQV